MMKTFNYYTALEIIDFVITVFRGINKNEIILMQIPKGKEFIKAKKWLKLLGIEISIKKIREYWETNYIVKIRKTEIKKERLEWLIKWLYKVNLSDIAIILRLLKDIRLRISRVVEPYELTIFRRYTRWWSFIVDLEQMGIIEIESYNCRFDYDMEEEECSYRGYLYP